MARLARRLGIPSAGRAVADQLQTSLEDYEVLGLAERSWVAKGRGLPDDAAAEADHVDVVVAADLVVPVSLPKSADVDQIKLREETEGAVDRGKADFRVHVGRQPVDGRCVEMGVSGDNVEQKPSLPSDTLPGFPKTIRDLR